jgi:TrmH family RNA methyltransferase
MGTLFQVPISQVDNPTLLLQWAKENGIKSVATSAKASSSFWDGDYDRPIVVILGNEGDGLPADILEKADQRVAIPMKGTASSLNLAVAAGLILYELTRPN